MVLTTMFITIFQVISWMIYLQVLRMTMQQHDSYLRIGKTTFDKITTKIAFQKLAICLCRKHLLSLQMIVVERASMVGNKPCFCRYGIVNVSCVDSAPRRLPYASSSSTISNRRPSQVVNEWCEYSCIPLRAQRYLSSKLPHTHTLPSGSNITETAQP